MSSPRDEAEDALRRAMKREIRDRMQQVRRALPESARAERAARILERLTALPAWRPGNTVLTYLSMPPEVDTAELARRAALAGLVVATTRTVPGDPHLAIHAWREDALEETPFGYLQPVAGAPSIDDGEVALAIVPGLAFDERGHRIGYGKGYYDRLLPRLARAERVALAFDFQLVPEVPDTPGDARVQVIVTDARVVRCTA